MDSSIKQVLVISVNMFLGHEQLQTIHDYFLEQMKTGVIILPTYCTAVLVPEGIEIRVENAKKLLKEIDIIWP